MKLDADITTKPTLRRVVLFLAVALIGLVLAHLLDSPVYERVHNSDAANRGLPKMFRGGGYIPLWVFVGLALAFLDTAKMKTQGLRGVLQRGLPIILAVIVAGMITEGAKTLLHRARPPEFGWDGHYQFRWGSDDPLSTDSVGMPSSHAGVAFGAAWILIRMYPRASPVWILIGIGCSYQRLLDRAHFFSDVSASALAGFVAAWAVWHGWRRWIGFFRMEDASPASPRVARAALFQSPPAAALSR
jgi:membrane-associated phospholipid phosphatase